mgnify:FL=1
MPVTYIGTASVVHHTVINIATPAVSQALLLMSEAGSKIIKNAKAITPTSKPKVDMKLRVINNLIV